MLRWATGEKSTAEPPINIGVVKVLEGNVREINESGSPLLTPKIILLQINLLSHHQNLKLRRDLQSQNELRIIVRITTPTTIIRQIAVLLTVRLKARRPQKSRKRWEKEAGVGK